LNCHSSFGGEAVLLLLVLLLVLLQLLLWWLFDVALSPSRLEERRSE
jgi:hypothetical protein